MAPAHAVAAPNQPSLHAHAAVSPRPRSRLSAPTPATQPRPSCSCPHAPHEPDVPLLLARLNVGFTTPDTPAPRAAPEHVYLSAASELLARRAMRLRMRHHMSRPGPNAQVVARHSTCLDAVAVSGHIVTWRGGERIANAHRHELQLYFSSDGATMCTAARSTAI
jgi:hypothetical protein